MSTPASSTLASDAAACDDGMVTGPIRVLMVDDHPLIRDGVRAALAGTDRIEIVGEAATVAEALDRVAALDPQVALLDVQLPDGSGADLCARLRESMASLKCLMLTSFDDSDTLFAAIQAGASGYLLKHSRPERLIEAIERVAAGDAVIDETLTYRLVEGIRSPQPTDDPLIASLTPLERSILRHLASGLTNKQIAAEMYLSTATVKNYVSSILRKLGVARRTEAAVFATRLGEL